MYSCSITKNHELSYKGCYMEENSKLLVYTWDLCFVVKLLSPGHGDNSLSREIKTFFLHVNQLLQGDTKMFASQAERYILSSVSLVCPGVSSWMGMPETTPQGDIQETSKPPQLAPLNMEEQRLYSEPLSDVRAPHHIWRLWTYGTCWSETLVFLKFSKTKLLRLMQQVELAATTELGCLPYNCKSFGPGYIH